MAGSVMKIVLVAIAIAPLLKLWHFLILYFCCCLEFWIERTDS